jgi:predicted alpha/beta superfamily hydrolase
MLALIAAFSLAQQSAEARTPSLTGDVRHHREFESKILGNKRDVVVYLPPQYESEPGRRYPVLYMHDGQNVFDGATSYLPNREWRADEAAEALIRAGMVEPLIIVGVANAGMARADEFLPTRAKRGDVEMGGRADDYGRFLTEEVKPFIDRTYRTKPGAKDTGLCGSSFGGIVTLHLGLTRPDVFTRLGVVSPSLWWDDGVMVKRVEGLAKKPPVKVWLDMGGDEGPQAVPDLLRLREAMVAKGWREGRDLRVVVEPRAQHNEDAWARRMDLILLWLYPAR